MQTSKSKYFSFTSAIVIICLMVGFSSCLKDNTERYDNSPPLVSFQYTGNSPVPFTAAILGTPQDSFALEVTLSVASLTLDHAVTATIAPDQATLDAYNADTTRANYPTIYSALDPSKYTLPNGGVVTINPGQQIVNFTVKFAGDQIDYTQDLAVALKIVSASGVTIATNLNTAVVIIKLKSIYEGSYTEDGTLTRFIGATESSGFRDAFPITGGYYFTTVTQTQIEGQIVIPGFAPTFAAFMVDPATNAVTIGSSGLGPNTSMANNPAKASTYDPATKTFDIHGQFLNSAGALREFDFTMTLN